jgi:asparagine synthetase B (glutamine-hydrolysing)
MQLLEDPFLHIRLRGREAEVTGSATARLGQVNLPASLQTGVDVFAEWHWDGKEVQVGNCRLGFFPIYYYATEDEFGVAASIEKLLDIGASRELDDAAMAVYLRMGWTLGADTIFRAIRALPPHGSVRWSGGRAKVSGDFAFPRPLAIGRNAAVDALGTLIAAAVRKRSGDGADTVMPLSGGRDSRSILFELRRCERLPKVFVTNHDFPPYRRENIDVSRMLANRLGARHIAIGQPVSRLRCELLKNRLNSFGAAENAWCVSLYWKLGREFSRPVVYEGSPGAASYGSYVDDDSISMLERGQTEALAARMLDRWLTWQASEEALQRIFSEEAASRFTRDAAIDRLSKELVRCLAAANPQLAFYFFNRGRQVAALQPFSIARRFGVATITPYLDHDLVDFVLALPPSVKVDKELHTDAILRCYPEFSDIPFAGQLKSPLVESNAHYRRLLFEMLGYVLAYGTGRLVQRGQIMRRLFAFATSAGNVRMRMRWIAPFAALYLTQVEALLDRPGGDGQGS